MHSSFYDFPRYDIIENSSDQELKVHWKENGKTLVIVTTDYQIPELNELLQKILGAINCTKDNTSILEIEEMIRIKIIDIDIYHSANSIICLGINPLDLGLSIEAKLFQKKSISKKSILFSPALSDLAQNLDYKKMLWSELKAHFVNEG